MRVGLKTSSLETSILPLRGEKKILFREMFDYVNGGPSGG